MARRKAWLPTRLFLILARPNFRPLPLFFAKGRLAGLSARRTWPFLLQVPSPSVVSPRNRYRPLPFSPLPRAHSQLQGALRAGFWGHQAFSAPLKLEPWLMGLIASLLFSGAKAPGFLEPQLGRAKCEGGPQAQAASAWRGAEPQTGGALLPRFSAGERCGPVLWAGWKSSPPDSLWRTACARPSALRKPGRPMCIPRIPPGILRIRLQTAGCRLSGWA